MPDRKTVRLTIADESVQSLRLDRFISENLELFSRSQIAHREVEAVVNGKTSKLSRKVSAGDELVVSFQAPELVSYQAEQLDLEILFENADVIVLNKPQGMVVHPAAGNYTGTLVQGLLHYCTELGETFEGEAIRPGIVHRLDKDTSGVIITAKHPRAQEYLAAQFRRKKTRKKYYAIVKGCMPLAEKEIETYIIRDRKNRKRFTVSEREGRDAITVYRPVKSWERYSFVSLAPVTGRTHQLRVHMKHINHPILGDPVYGRKDHLLPDATLMLHAYSLSITLPGEYEPRTFRAVLPQRFKVFLSAIEVPQKPD